MFALGIVIPVAPRLIESFVGGDTATAAEWVGVFGTAWALMQFICSPLLGALSDRFGRRPVILLSNFGLGLDYILMALAPTLGWLFVGRVISGITGASFTTAGAYIADVTPPEKRAAGFGMLGAAFGIGFVLGPALGGVLGSIDLRLPFWVAGALTLLNAIYGLFILPESLPRERRTAFSLARANPLGSLRLLRRHRELLGLASVCFLYFIAHQVLQSVFVLYTAYRYNWDERTVGLTLAFVGVTTAIMQGGIVRVVVRKFGERRALYIGLLAGAIGYAGFGLAGTGIQFWLAIPVMAFMGLFNPSAQGLMTRHVAPGEQGQLQGANSSIMGITGMLGPAMFTLTFATFIRRPDDLHMPGAPFLLAGLIMLVALAIALRVTRNEADAPVVQPVEEVAETVVS